MNSKSTLFCIIFLIFLCIPMVCVAQDAVDESTLAITAGDESAVEGDGSLNVFTVWDFVRMLLILGAVIAVIYLVFFLLKRSGKPRIQENRMIRVLSSKLLSNNRTLHLIEVGNQIFLVGAAENTVSLVSEIADKETLDGIRLQAADTEAVERKNFGEILSQIFGRPQNGQSGNRANLDPVAFLKGQRQRLKNI